MNGIIKVVGGNKLTGEITPVSNKNAVVAVLPLCLLTNKDCIFNNLPDTSDVQKILQMLKKLGADVDDSNFSKVVINCKKVNNYEVDFELGSTIRASLNFAGPLLARFGKAKIPLPGGCTLGIRSINTHLDSFSKAGIKYETTNTHVILEKNCNPNSIIWQSEASVTASENLISYLASIELQINVIEVATEPHVSQLEEVLKQMGCQINGISSNHLIIKGKQNLSGFEFTPDPDFVDITGHIVAAAITKGNVTIKNGNKFFMTGILEWLKKFNVSFEKGNEDLVINQKEDLELIDFNKNFPLASEGLPKFLPRPWPGFPVDCLPAIVTLATQTKGKILINNWMYETGLEYVTQLKQLGANIKSIDNQKIIVEGPCNYLGTEVTPPDIIEANKAVFLAALVCKGETILSNANFLKRRYATLIDDYKKLGAKINILE